jgi:hypothetical protein
MLCLPPAALNPSATLGPSPQPCRKRPSRAAGSCFHHVETFGTATDGGERSGSLQDAEAVQRT